MFDCPKCSTAIKGLLTWPAVVLILLCSETTFAIKPPIHPERPHIVLMLADDLGWNDVSFHGSKEIPTPNIDALARDGIIFNQHYVQPMCSPSRAALMTGKYPIRLGFQDFVIMGPAPWGLSLDEKILPQYLKSLNYKTHAVGKWHLGFFKEEYLPNHRGFDSFFGSYGGVKDYFTHEYHDHFFGVDLHDNDLADFRHNGTYSPDLFTERATDIIFNHNRSEPLFLYVSHQTPHVGNYGDHYSLQTSGKYFDPLTKMKDFGRRIFGGMMSALDDSVGSIFAALEQTGMLDDTIFIFMSDNGCGTLATDGTRGSNYPLRGAKYTNWEGGIRSVSFIWSPILRNVSRTYHELMHITDWLPTLLAAAGGSNALATLSDIDGVNHWPSLKTLSTPPRSELLININPIDGTSAFRSGRFKVIKGETLHFYDDGWYIEGKPIINGNVSVPSLAETRIQEDVYKEFLERSSVATILKKKYGKDPYQILKCEAPFCKELVVDCNGIRPVESNCKPKNKTCLFDVINDPCEFHNIANDRPDLTAKLEERMEELKSVMIPPVINFVDPKAHPKFHGNAWMPWRL